MIVGRVAQPGPVNRYLSRSSLKISTEHFVIFLRKGGQAVEQLRSMRLFCSGLVWGSWGLAVCQTFLLYSAWLSLSFVLFFFAILILSVRNWWYARDNILYIDLVVMDQHPEDDEFGKSRANEAISLRSTNNEGDKSNRCNQCEYASSVKSSLKNHIKIHSGEKPNKCNQCDYASSHASDLRKHLKTHSGEKSNKCNQCDYASSQAGHLRRHLKTHSGEKPNKCNQCDYASSQAGNLRRHLKTHGGEKSNKCNQCDYASSYASALKTHLKTHSGEKSNKCNQCDYASSQASNLMRHMKTHSGEK